MSLGSLFQTESIMSIFSNPAFIVAIVILVITLMSMGANAATSPEGTSRDKHTSPKMTDTLLRSYYHPSRQETDTHDTDCTAPQAATKIPLPHLWQKRKS